MNKSTIISVLVIAVAVIAGLVILQRSGGDSSKYDELAVCLGDKGATFYGAFWCPHCNAQKGFFGTSAKLLPYVECSTPDGKGQTPICIEKGIKSYPTWIFADGTQITGEQQPGVLAEKVGCPMPADAGTEATPATGGQTNI